MNKLKLRIITVLATLFLIINYAFATSIQIFTPLAFYNPARYELINHFQFIVADTAIMQHLKVSGVSAGIQGTATSNKTMYFPEFSWALRLNPHVVFAVNVSKPFAMDDEYSDTAFVRFVSTLSRVNSTDISPNIAVKLNKNLSVGFGLDYLDFSADFNSIVPPNATVPSSQPFSFDVENWGKGWHTGLFYHMLKGTFVGLSYYSQIGLHLTGHSEYGNLARSNNTFLDTTMPATINFSAIQYLNKQWFLEGIVRYTFWHVLQQLDLERTALGNLPPIALNYKNRFSYGLFSDYHFNTHWALLNLISWSPTPSDTNNESPRAPNGDTLGLGAGVEYAFSKNVNLKAFYEHSFVKDVTINRRSIIGIYSSGTAHMSDNAVSLILTFKE